MRTVEEVYGSAMAGEEAFQAALDQSLAPRGFGLLFDLVADLGCSPALTAGLTGPPPRARLANDSSTVYNANMTRRAMREASFMLLTVLADARQHGCGIASGVRANPGGLARASDADREHVIDMLKAAFVQGRLTRDELDMRVGQALASRSHAGLAALTADIPAGLAGARPLPWPGSPAVGRLATASSTIYIAYMSTRAMQEATFLILTALADSSQHGYGIITEVREISGGRVRLRAGTLYTALDRLRADGLIEVDREEIVDNRLRRYYRLTPAGSKRLAAEAARLHAHAIAALSRLNLAGGMAT
jgi:DNA-binding PadR family transcriptional regulator